MVTVQYQPLQQHQFWEPPAGGVHLLHTYSDLFSLSSTNCPPLYSPVLPATSRLCQTLSSSLFPATVNLEQPIGYGSFGVVWYDKCLYVCLCVDVFLSPVGLSTTLVLVDVLL